MKANSTTLTTLLWVMVLSAFSQMADISDAKSASIYPNDGHGTKRVDEALALAQWDNKRVLLKIGGDWCGWCHKLHDVLKKDEDLDTVLSHEYVLVMIENKADKAVLGKWNIHPKGYPYLAVLDASVLQTSDNPQGGNIGLLSDPEREIAYFQKMLENARQRMTSDDVTHIVEELQAFAKSWQ